MLVRGIGGPVAGRGEDLADNEAVGLQRGGGAEVVDLAGAVAGSAQFDGRLRGGDRRVGYETLAGAVATATRPPSAEVMVTALPVPEYRRRWGR